MFSIYRSMLSGAFLMLTSSVVLGQYSDIWGTSNSGGEHGNGYLFRMDADGAGFEQVHQFEGGILGQWPNGALTEGPDGRLYGITAAGGEHGTGVIYSYDPQYALFTIEYHPSVFLGQKFLLAPDGKFYINSAQSGGSMYAYDPLARSLDLVYDYVTAEGRSTFADTDFILVDDHRIIGTTYSGGSMDDGVLFEYDLDTETWRVLHHFGLDEGRMPSPTLAQQGRKLYGTTIWGAGNGRGALFEYDLDTETLTVKADFTEESSQARGVCVGLDGKVYLQAGTGGIYGHGGVLRYDPSTGDFDLIHSFSTTGTNIPTGSMMQTWAGRMFGVTRYGGSGKGLGTIYEVNTATENVSVRQSFDDGFPSDTRLLEVGERTVTSVGIQTPATSIDSDNGTLSLSATLLPAEAADQPVVWSVNNSAVASINADGLLTAVGNGTVVVTATANYGLGVSDTMSITVTHQDGVAPVIPVESIELSPSTVFFTALGDTQQLYADVFPGNADNPAVTWASLDTSVASVSASGLVQAVGAGTTTITAAAVDGSGITASLEVNVTQLVTSLMITPGTDIIDDYGGTIDFDVIVTPANATNPDVTWSASSISATIDQNGVLTPLGNGTVTVTATANDGSEVTATRTVTMNNQYVEVLVMNAYSTRPRSDVSTITEDHGTLQMTVSYYPSDATDPMFTWVSTKPSIATVDQNGLVTAVSNGKTTIRTTSVDGPQDTHEVWVFYQAAGPVSVSSIELTPETAAINERGGTLAITATILPENAVETDISWQVIGSGASISQDGVVTGIDKGEVQVRASTLDIYGRTIYSPLSTITLTNQDDPLARIEPEFSIVDGKARITYTRFIPDPGVTIAYEGTSDLKSDWSPLVLNTDYTLHDSTDNGDGTETRVLELMGDAPERFFLKVLAVEE